MQRIEGHQDLRRDESTRAVINNSKSDFHAFMQQRNEKLSYSERLTALEQKIQELDSMLVPRLQNLEQMLQELLQRD